MFSKKATKIDKIFTVDLTLLYNVKLTVKISSIFVAFFENMNFTMFRLKEDEISKNLDFPGKILTSQEKSGLPGKNPDFQKTSPLTLFQPGGADSALILQRSHQIIPHGYISGNILVLMVFAKIHNVCKIPK